MEQFTLIQPSNLLKSYVKQYWFLAIDDAVSSSQRYIPSGCAMLAFHRGDRIYSTLHQLTQPRSSLCGSSTLFTDILYSGHLNLIIVVFQSIAARAVFGIPMNELREKNMDIGVLADASLLDLEKKLMETKDSCQCVYFIEQYLVRKLGRFSSDRFNRMHAVIQSINEGQQDINELSRMTCLGYKQFQRIFSEYTGLKPKEFLKIARFHRVLHHLHADTQAHLSQLAFDWGYCDKSHLIKDFRAFTGYTPQTYLSVCDPYSEYLSLFNSVFINGEKKTKCNE